MLAQLICPASALAVVNLGCCTDDTGSCAGAWSAITAASSRARIFA
jgi:hypothetical protein